MAITHTETVLRVDAVTEAYSVTVHGRLTSADGASIPVQSVTVTVGGTVRSTVTNRTGWYRLTVSNVSGSDAATPSPVPVTARFDGAGTNLNTSRARTTVEFPNSSADSESMTGGSSSLAGSQTGSRTFVGALVGGGVLGLLVLLGAVLWVRRGVTTDDPAPAPADRPDSLTGSDTITPSQQ